MRRYVNTVRFLSWNLQFKMLNERFGSLIAKGEPGFLMSNLKDTGLRHKSTIKDFIATDFKLLQSAKVACLSG